MNTYPSHILEARYRADDAAAKAHAELSAELLDAIQVNPKATIVRTPGFGARRYTAAEVVADQLDGDTGPLLAMLKLLIDAAMGDNVEQAATDLLYGFAKQHADYHADCMECDE